MRTSRTLLFTAALLLTITGLTHAQSSTGDPSSGCAMQLTPVLVPAQPAPSMDPDLLWGPSRITYLWSVMDRFLSERSMRTAPLPVASRVGASMLATHRTASPVVFRRVR